MSFNVVDVLFCVLHEYLRGLEVDCGIKAYINKRRHNSLSSCQVFQRHSKGCSNNIKCYRLIIAVDIVLFVLPFKVMRRKGQLVLTRDRQRFDGTNPGFCDVELDLTKRNIPA